MAKWDATICFPSNDSRSSIDLEGIELDATDSDDAAEELSNFISENIELQRVQQTYDVTVELRLTLSFEYEDESGEYEDEGDVQDAIERGDIDPANFVTLEDGDMEIQSVDVAVQ